MALRGGDDQHEWVEHVQWEPDAPRRPARAENEVEREARRLREVVRAREIYEEMRQQFGAARRNPDNA